MRSAALLFACLPLVMVGLLLIGSPRVVDRELADGASLKSDTGRQMADSQSPSVGQREVLPGYGDISGQILFVGELPIPKLLFKQADLRVKGAAICATHDMQANDLLVDPKTKGIANVFVYIDTRNIKRHGIKVYPDAELAEKPPLVVRQTNCRYVPHAMVIQTGQSVLVWSDDECAHNVHPSLLTNDEFSSIQYPHADGVQWKREFDVAEPLPMPVKCDIHPWMKAYWLIIDHPYATVTDKEGRFTIAKLPVGEIEFRIWHEVPGYIDRKYKVTVEEGETELDPVRVPACRFE